MGAIARVSSPHLLGEFDANASRTPAMQGQVRKPAWYPDPARTFSRKGTLWRHRVSPLTTEIPRPKCHRGIENALFPNYRSLAPRPGYQVHTLARGFRAHQKLP